MKDSDYSLFVTRVTSHVYVLFRISLLRFILIVATNTISVTLYVSGDTALTNS